VVLRIDDDDDEDDEDDNTDNNPLAPWSRGLPEKLTGPQVAKKFPTFYRTQMFITAFTRACHLSLS
jgi:hypothetical protein